LMTATIVYSIESLSDDIGNKIFFFNIKYLVDLKLCYKSVASVPLKEGKNTKIVSLCHVINKYYKNLLLSSV
jgi:hypothetical protein